MKPKKYVNGYGYIEEGIQLTADNLHKVVKWCGGKVWLDIDGTPYGVRLGARYARKSDWVMKKEWMEGRHRFGVCKQDMFDRLFSEVDDGSDE